jgi:hypothetical protein
LVYFQLNKIHWIYIVILITVFCFHFLQPLPLLFFFCPTITIFPVCYSMIHLGQPKSNQNQNLPSPLHRHGKKNTQKTNKQKLDLPETSTCLYQQQTSWCTRRRSTSQSQTIWTRLSQNSRRTRDINNATAPSTTTTIHFRLDFSREHYHFLCSLFIFCVDFFVPFGLMDWDLDRKY